MSSECECCTYGDLVSCIFMSRSRKHCIVVLPNYVPFTLLILGYHICLKTLFAIISSGDRYCPSAAIYYENLKIAVVTEFNVNIMSYEKKRIHEF